MAMQTLGFKSFHFHIYAAFCHFAIEQHPVYQGRCEGCVSKVGGECAHA